MAADWIKIENFLPNKPEVAQMADRLGVTDNEVVGMLVRFWSWVDQTMSDECPDAYGTTGRIGVLAGHPEFADAMVEVGWLVFSGENSIRIPNYEDHLSQSAKRRAVEAKKKARQRASSRKCPDEDGTPCPDGEGTNRGPEKRRGEGEGDGRPYGTSTSTKSRPPDEPPEGEPSGRRPSPPARGGPSPSPSPSPEKPSPEKPTDAPPSDGAEESPVDWAAAKDAARKMRDRAWPESGRALSPQDRRLLLQLAAAVQAGALPEAVAWDAVDATAQKSPANPGAFLTRCIENQARERGLPPFRDTRKRFQVPESQQRRPQPAA